MKLEVKEFRQNLICNLDYIDSIVMGMHQVNKAEVLNILRNKDPFAEIYFHFHKDEKKLYIWANCLYDEIFKKTLSNEQRNY